MTTLKKGTVWEHASRTNLDGTPETWTITLISDSNIYSTNNQQRKRMKLSAISFQKACGKIVSAPPTIDEIIEQDRNRS